MGTVQEGLSRDSKLVSTRAAVEADSTLIPTGKIESVKGTPLDFTKPTVIGARINDQNEQLKVGGGYDHNFVIHRKGEGMTLATRVVEPTSGRILEIDTTEPGVQFYTGNFLDGMVMGKNGIAYQYRYGFCLETQHYPASPNQPNFPSTILKPGQIHRTRTAFKFSVVK
jgi:aldose 1-epimerase